MFLQSDTIIFDVCGKSCPNYTQKKSLLFLCNILRGKWMTKLTFCMQVSMQAHYKLILWFWLRWSSISKVPKIASVQCLYNISKRKIEINWFFACRSVSKWPPTLWAPKLTFFFVGNISRKLGMKEWMLCCEC